MARQAWRDHVRRAILGHHDRSAGMSATLNTTAPTRLVIRAVVYYAVLTGGGALVWNLLPHAGGFAPTSLDALFGGGPPVTRGMAALPLDEVTLAITVSVAMLAAGLLALPVACVYQLTLAKRAYQHSVLPPPTLPPLLLS